MLENKSTRRPKKPAAAAKKAAPKVAVKSAPIEGNGEVRANQGENAAILIDPIRELVKILAENIGHNTELLKQIDRRRADQPGDRPPVVEQLRTILNYKAIGQMTGRSGTPFQDNLIDAHRDNSNGDQLVLLLPFGAAKVSVQVDGDPNADVFPVNPGGKTLTLDKTKGRDIGRIEVLNSDLEPIRLGPRMVALRPPNTP